MIVTFLQHFINIFVESAPWLLLGFFIAGLIKAFVPVDFLYKHLGGNTVGAVVKGAILGAPLPLCSCGVIPAALGVRRAGASKAATTSFLIATPETGVDSVSVTYALLGPLMAVIRPIAAVTTAITAGLAVLWHDQQHDDNHDDNERLSSTDKASSCCSTSTAATQQATACCDNESTPKTSCCSSKQPTETTTSSCCSTKTVPPAQAPSPLMQKIRSGLSFTFIDLIKDTVVWLLIGLVLAALIMTLIPPEFLAKWGSSPYAYFIMAIIGVPMYICATASTPIAAGLLFAGVSPGAVLVFLLVGPATNIATLAIVKNELGRKVLTIYLSVIVVMSFLFGWLTDILSKQFGTHIASHAAAHEHTSSIALLSAVFLAGLLINGLRKKYLVR